MCLIVIGIITVVAVGITVMVRENKRISAMEKEIQSIIKTNNKIYEDRQKTKNLA